MMVPPSSTYTDDVVDDVPGETTGYGSPRVSSSIGTIPVAAGAVPGRSFLRSVFVSGPPPVFSTITL